MNDAEEIGRLIFDYARLIDAGDFAGLGRLFASGEIRSRDLVVTGANDVAAHFEATVRRFDDGTPHTRHVTTNVVVDTDGTSARAHSYVSVYFKESAEQELRLIFVGGYDDEFDKSDGAWRFRRRTYLPGLSGDMRGHLITG